LSNGYPIVLDVREQLVVIIGGGAVAVRKARGVIDAGATRVRVISPTFHQDMPPQVQRVEQAYQGGAQLAGAGLVFAATDQPDVNDAVARDAHAIGALVCRADVEEGGESGDFSTPAVLRDGPLLISVSSGGGSPALSAMIRNRLAKAIDPRWVRMAQAMQTLRPIIREKVRDPVRRREMFKELCADAAADQLAAGGIEQLSSWLGERFPELK